MRGVDNIAIESECSFGVPKDTWTEGWKHITTDEERADERNKNYTKNGDTAVVAPKFLDGTPNLGCAITNKKLFSAAGEKRPEVMPWEIMTKENTPSHWDWRNVDGKNYCGWSKN